MLRLVLVGSVAVLTILMAVDSTTWRTRSRLTGLMAATFVMVVLALLVIVPATRAPTPS